jgi:hypothetical protein
MWDGDVDTNGNGGSVGGGEQVNGDIEGAEPGMVRQALCRFALDVMLSSN